MSIETRPVLTVLRLDRAPILLGVLIIPLAATGALSGVGFWFGPDGALRLGTGPTRFVLVERERRDPSEVAIEPIEEELESVPDLHHVAPSTLRATATAAAQRTVVGLTARSCAAPRATCRWAPAPPRAPPAC